MVEYIEREAAIKGICYGCTPQLCSNDCGMVARVKDIPAADVRCVVTCSECKHWNRNEEGNLCCTKDADEDESFPGQYFGFISYHRPDFFCADGERRENT